MPKNDKSSEDKPFLTIDLLDEDAKKQVIECIKKRGKLSLFAHPKGSARRIGSGGYSRID
jgi:hypothetical protein